MALALGACGRLAGLGEYEVAEPASSSPASSEAARPALQGPLETGGEAAVAAAPPVPPAPEPAPDAGATPDASEGRAPLPTPPARPDLVVEWNHQGGVDRVDALAVDVSGNVFAAGTVTGALPDQTTLGGRDGFVRKYAPDGAELWTSQFGSDSDEFIGSIGVDASGSSFVGGSMFGVLPGQVGLGDFDGFVRKYAPDGTELWTSQFGTASYDSVDAVAVDGGGNVLVAGTTEGALVDQPLSGWGDGFVRKYAADGSVLWTRQFSSVEGSFARALSVDASGNAFVAGFLFGAFPGQSSAGQQDGFLRKYAPDGAELWTRQFGGTRRDFANSVSVDGSGNAFVVGETETTLPSGASSQDLDVFLRKFDPSGSELWARQFGTIYTDGAADVRADPSGGVLVAGYTEGLFPDQLSSGLSGDMYLRAYETSGNETWTHQFDATLLEGANALAVDATGAILLGGYTSASPSLLGPSGIPFVLKARRSP